MQRSIFRWQHAEMNALAGIYKHDLRKAIMYVVRIGKDDNFKISKPCNDCQRIITIYNIKKVIYTDRNGKPAILRL